jgi:hypothetical protein
MGNFIIVEMVPNASPFPPAEFVLLISVPDIVGPQIEKGFFCIVAKDDPTMPSTPDVAVLIKFGPISLDVHLQQDSRNLSGPDSFLRRGAPTGYQAENYCQQEDSGLHRFIPYRTMVFPLVEGALLPWILL